MECFVLINVVLEIVFGYVNSFFEFNCWLFWVGIDFEIEYEFSGLDLGVGSRMSWMSEDNNVGFGI